MSSSQADAPFRTFVRTGDPAALGRVFDLLAPDLALVAAHVAPHGVEAEDLVQATFLAAIEGRAGFDVERPVRPWLVGVLCKQAMRAQRDGLRRPAPDRTSRRTPADPADEAGMRELCDSVDRAVAGLPSAYRQVLRLRLIHGLKMIQIARALDVPLPTAKARLRRGLEQLRRALPQGLTSGGALFALPERGLGAVRDEVLAQAARAGTGGAAVGAAVGAGVLAKIAASIAIVAGLLGWQTFGEPTPPDHAVTASSRAGALQAAASHDTGAGPAEPPAAPAAHRSVLPISQDPQIEIRGRCVARESGRPLPGCEIRVVAVPGMMRSAEERAAWSAVDQAARRIVSGDDGRFAIQVPRPGRFGLSIRVRLPGRVYAECNIPKPGARVDAGDVALRRPVPLAGRVVDLKGEPVEGAALRFLPVVAPVLWGDSRLRFIDGFAGQLRTDASGRFELRDGLGAGTWSIWLGPDDHIVIRPGALQIEADQDRVELEIVVKRPDRSKAAETLSGTVRDRAGDPVAGLELSLGGGVKATTGADGRFELARRNARGPLESLGIMDPVSRFPVRFVPGPLPWGRPGFEISLERLGSVELQVVEAHTGRPVERFALRRFPLGTGQYKQSVHPEGRVSLDAVEWGRTAVLVLPEDPGLAPCEVLTLRQDLVDSGVAVVELHRRVELRVQVRHRDGQPVVGSAVEVIADNGHRLPPASVPLAKFQPAGAMLVAAQLARAVTDEHGDAILRLAPSERARAIAVRGRHLPVVERDLKIRAASTRRVVVSSGATIKGRLQPLAVLEQIWARPIWATNPADPTAGHDTPGVFLQRRDGDQQFIEAPLGGWKPDAEGRFAIHGVADGNWRVILSYGVRVGHSSAQRRTAVGEVDRLREGETRDAVFDLRSLVPGTLEGAIVLDGLPHAMGQFDLLHDEDGVVAGLYTGRRGEFRQAGLPPASYRAVAGIRSEETGRLLHVLSDDSVTLAPDAVTKHTFAVRRRTCRIRVLSADGTTPFAGRYFEVRRPGGDYFIGLRAYAWDHKTDAEGWLTLEAAPPGPFALRLVVAPGQHRELARYLRDHPDAERSVREWPLNWLPIPVDVGPFEVPAPDTSAVFTARMAK